ncbi:MAG: hypothetical protein IPK60_01140 [Sandaracinaceae bacterium]|nr:hypothetical protein [Sandaracinaceae bacterium]
MSWRSAVGSSCVALVLLATLWVPRDGNAQATSPNVHHVMISLPGPDGTTPQRVLLTWPRRGGPTGWSQRESDFPVLIALHGAAEAELEPARGTLAWNAEYRVDSAISALMSGSLSVSSFGGLVRDARLRVLNDQLRTRVYRGVVLATPYTPNLLSNAPGSAAIRTYSDWLAGPLLAAIRANAPVLATRDATGIDGVSLGGRLALEAGFLHPEAFGMVEALQPALGGVVDAIARQAIQAAHTAPQNIRIVSSDGDAGLEQARALSTALRAAHITHELAVVRGAHGYEFNRGPGAIEMMLHADRALRGVL